MRLHVPAPSHTIVSDKYSHEGFTHILIRFAKMMRAQGATVIEYGNEGSESPADEHVVLRSKVEHEALYPFTPGRAILPPAFDGPAHLAFRQRFLAELAARAKPGDIVIHGHGPAHSDALTAFPSLVHIEPFIGYDSGPFGAYRGFNSEAWRHFHLGKYSGHDTKAARESWVLPLFYDLEDWPLGTGGGSYYAFMARKCNAKGLKVLAEIIRRYEGPHHFRIAGPGEEWTDWAEFCRSIGALRVLTPGSGITTERGIDVENLGCIPDKDRATFLGDAVALLCPTQYVEPGGGVAIEAMMCGTPVIGSDWGCFTETLPETARCRTVDAYLLGMAAVGEMRWGWVRELYSLDTVGRQYARVFEEMARLRNVGTSR